MFFGFLITNTIYMIEICTPLPDIKAAYSLPQELLQQTNGTATVKMGAKLLVRTYGNNRIVYISCSRAIILPQGYIQILTN